MTPPTIPDGLVVQGIDVLFGNGGKKTKQSILVFYGLHDNLLVSPCANHVRNRQNKKANCLCVYVCVSVCVHVLCVSVYVYV